MKRLIALSVVLALTACAGTPSKPAAVYDVSKNKPTQHQAVVKKIMSATLKDPDSAKYTFGKLSVEQCRPGLYSADRIKAWVFPILVNAKNSYGAYAGKTGYKFYFAGNELVGYFPTKQGVLDLCPTSDMARIEKLAKQ